MLSDSETDSSSWDSEACFATDGGEESETEDNEEESEEARLRRERELNRYTYDTFPVDGRYSPNMFNVLPNDLPNDHDLFSFVRLLSNDNELQSFLKEIDMRPKGRELPEARNAGHPVVGDFFGICKDLNFNPQKPVCTGKVSSKTRVSKKNPNDTLYYYQYVKHNL